jgi:hypothetical protein
MAVARKTRKSQPGAAGQAISRKPKPFSKREEASALAAIDEMFADFDKRAAELHARLDALLAKSPA